MRNIDNFDEVVGIVFARLYANFPVPDEFSSGDIVNLMKRPEGDGVDDFEDGFAILTDVIPATVSWLEEEGFIRFKNNSTLAEKSWREVRLTSKALSALKSTPGSIEPEVTIGERISAAAREGGGEVLRAGVNQLLTAGVRAWAGV